MKFTLALALAGLVSCIGATDLETTTRDLQDDRYHIYQNLAVALDGADSFKLTANHREADSGTSTTFAGLRYIYLFKKCPHGEGPAQAGSGDSNFLGKLTVSDNSAQSGTQPAWLTTKTAIATTSAGSGNFQSVVSFTVLPTVSSVSSIWTFLEASPDKGTAEFCMFFGLGNKDGTPKEVYGFREIVLKAEFLFDGKFTCTSFTTQAYDPVTGSVTTTKTYGAAATNCSPLTPVRPGTPACMEVCPSPVDPLELTYIKQINQAWICEKPASTSAPDKTNIVGPSTAGVPWKVICDSDDGLLGDQDVDGGAIPASGIAGDASNPYTDKVKKGCCRVLWTLPARYFPTIDAENPPIFNPTDPDIATFEVCGEVDVRPVTLTSTGEKSCEKGESGKGCKKHCPEWEGGDKDKRALRQLQEAEATPNENGILASKVEFIVAPADASSSRSSIAAGAAAAVGALGAALLI